MFVCLLLIRHDDLSGGCNELRALRVLSKPCSNWPRRAEGAVCNKKYAQVYNYIYTDPIIPCTNCHCNYTTHKMSIVICYYYYFFIWI